LVKFKPDRPPVTLGAAARVRLIIWCRACQHQVEPELAEMAARHGADMTVLEWRERLVCSRCGSRKVDMVLSGAKLRSDP
jgi:Zn finger protein HypA/HybF involved in hydrogenase expression